MKTSVQLFALVFAFVATAFSATAEDKEAKKSSGFGTGMYATKSGTIRVMVEKIDRKASTTIRLKDDQGKIVYAETVNRSIQLFSRTLNVDELSTGKYEVEVMSNGEKQTKSFELIQPKSERILQVR